jgi:hypothetical protein
MPACGGLTVKTVFLLALLIIAPSLAAAQSPSPTPSASPVPAADTDAGAQNGYTRPDADARRKRYFNSMVGPIALARTVGTAGISTWRNSPEEWGTKWEGFGRRVASNFGRNVIKQTTIYGLDEALKVDSNFYRSKNKSVSARIGNALISPVTARKANGKRTIGVPRLVGTYGAAIISREVWYPSGYDWKDGVRSGTISLGFNAAFNLVKEFIWKK